jgi:hypothetical protein
MSYMFSTCWELEELLGFSATNKAGISITFPTGTTARRAFLKRLTFKNVANSIRSAINVQYCSIRREGMVEMFNSLPDITKESISDANKTITILGNPCVTGEFVLSAGSYVTINSMDDARKLFKEVPLNTEVMMSINNGGKLIYDTLSDALLAIEQEAFPMYISWNSIEFPVEELTAEDRAIATNKGWTLVEA